MRKAEELAAERGITPAQAFEKLLVARQPELEESGEMRSGAVIRHREMLIPALAWHMHIVRLSAESLDLRILEWPFHNGDLYD
jgi:hypothetical protein